MTLEVVILGIVAGITGFVSYCWGYARGVAEQYDHTFMKRRREDFSAPRNDHA